jgi:hypothetical protein
VAERVLEVDDPVGVLLVELDRERCPERVRVGADAGAFGDADDRLVDDLVAA